MKKGLFLLLCGVLLAGLLFVMLFPTANQQPVNHPSVLPGDDVSGPLVMQKSALLKQRDQMQKEYTARIRGMGTVTLLFTQPDAVFMDIVVPMLTESGLVGMVAFDLECYPGMENCITLEQWRQLEQAGWEVCLRWDGKTMLPQWMDNMNRILSSLGMTSSLTVYVPEGLFTTQLLSQARQLNLKALIHHGEDTGTKYEYIIQTNDVWLPQVTAWHLENTSEEVLTTVSAGGSMVLEVYNEIIWEGGYRRLFQSMLEKLLAWQKEDTLRVATVSEAISYRRGVVQGRLALELEMQEHLEKLNLEIEQLDEEIKALYPSTQIQQ